MASLTPSDWGNLARAIRATSTPPHDSDILDGHTMVNMQVWNYLLPAMEYLSHERESSTSADSDN